MARIIISILLILFSFQSHSQIAMFHAHNQMPSDLFLDTYTGATGAWSTQKLRNAYTGYCIQVINSSLTTRDIGFLGNHLDTVDLKSFGGSGTLWVRIFYNQSIVGHDLYGADAFSSPNLDTVNFPKILIGGVVQRLNGVPALYFDGSNDAMSGTATKTLTTSQSAVIVFQNHAGSDNFGRVLSQRDTLRRDFDDYIPIVRNGTTTTFASNASLAGGLQAGKTITDNVSYIWLNVHTGSQIQNSINNGTDATYTHSLSVTPYRYRLSGDYSNAGNEDGPLGIKGLISEAVIWGNVNQSSNKAAIFSNINSRHNTIY